MDKCMYIYHIVKHWQSIRHHVLFAHTLWVVCVPINIVQRRTYTWVNGPRRIHSRWRRCLVTLSLWWFCYLHFYTSNLKIRSYLWCHIRRGIFCKLQTYPFGSTRPKITQFKSRTIRRSVFLNNINMSIDGLRGSKIMLGHETVVSVAPSA